LGFQDIGTGFIYGSLGLTLFGVLILAGNTVPAQLSQLSLPKYIVPSPRRHIEAEGDSSPSIDEGKRFFFSTLICGAFLFVTGLFMKMLDIRMVSAINSSFKKYRYCKSQPRPNCMYLL
jgi:hypothetical protein